MLLIKTHIPFDNYLKRWYYNRKEEKTTAKYTYPAIFTDTETNILIEVPDLEILTEANSEGEAKGSLADAIAMARDAIGTACITQEENHKELNSPSPIETIDASKGVFAKNGRSIVLMVDVDLTVCRKAQRKP